MALPRPTLLAIAGVLLSLMSFMSMRTIGTERAADLGVPTLAGESPAPADDASAKPASKEPEPRVEDVPPALADALADGKVAVLLFAEDGADDVATARHFGTLSQLGNRVSTFRAGIEDVGRYAGVVADLGISQAPAIVIVRPDLRAAPPIEGYVESQYLLQRVKDQLR
ncbi:MAG TPA: hypothetical protein VD790_04905 [Thermoleophilaceae bacterium]|nr:hypothetical protein [Thermoleophilaceae bacterium]